MTQQKQKRENRQRTPLETQICNYESRIRTAKREITRLEQEHAEKVGRIKKRLAGQEEVLRKLKG